MLHLLQICNVGNIVGGTAACAWTITRTLPHWQHSVAFLSPPTAETTRNFAHTQTFHWKQVVAEQIRSLAPDLIILHNTSHHRCPADLPAPTLQYLHSRISPAPADHTIHCSRWLAGHDSASVTQPVGRASRPVYRDISRNAPETARNEKQNLNPVDATEVTNDPRHSNNDPDYREPLETVCLQAVPRPPQSTFGDHRRLRPHPVIGRICTPTALKWPTELLPLYEKLARTLPQARWEFVGCPTQLQPQLKEVLGGNTLFHPAGWMQRSLLWQWDALLYHNPHVTESFGRTVAEALRAGCVPIVDDRGGFREQIIDGTGFLCRSADDFAAALRTLADEGERLRLSRAAAAHGNTVFSLEQFAGRLQHHLRAAAITATARLA